MVSLPTTWDVSRTDYRALKNEWHAVARFEEVADGQIKRVRLLGQDLVLWRGDNSIHAWDDYCAHRGARLSLGMVSNCRLVCPYHGWEYQSDGKCVRYPAHPSIKPSGRAAATVYEVSERFGHIWVCMGKPRRCLPAFPEWGDESYRKVFAGPYSYATSSFRAVENFLDVAHFPFVHPNYNGDPDNPDSIEDYRVRVSDDGLTVDGITVFQPSGDQRGIPVHAAYEYAVFGPTIAWFNKQTGATEKFATLLAVTPVDVDKCVLWLIVATNFGHELPADRIIARQNVVYEQDRLVVESQRPKAPNFSLSEDLHLRSDQTGVKFRAWIRELAEQDEPRALAP